MKQLKKLTKIVNKINDNYIEMTFFNLEIYKYYNIEITLQDLLLALHKKTPFKIVSNTIFNGLIEMAFIELEENGYKVNETLIFDLSQPPSNQKPEVYNKLINILK